MSSLPVRDERCGTCKFWEDGPRTLVDAHGFGDCRRFPPPQCEWEEFHEGGSAYTGRWPATEDADWCGEWRAKRKVPPPATPAPGDATLHNIGLSVRARKVCIRLGVKTPAELAAKPWQEVLAAKNCGMTTLYEMRDRLAAVGLCFDIGE
jgi:hypothetical protein